jgi:8-oxo-dGTP pyrophosphatase MutT (NUDIX family)
MGATPRQVAVVPVRRAGNELEICLIRRTDSRKWGIPKGFIDRGDTPEQAALNEAHEEAGLKGDIVTGIVGTYEYEKWDTDLTVAVYVMRVRDVDEKWREMSFRERRWASLAKADRLLAKHPVRPFLSDAIKHLKNVRVPSPTRRAADGPSNSRPSR